MYMHIPQNQDEPIQTHWLDDKPPGPPLDQSLQTP